MSFFDDLGAGRLEETLQTVATDEGIPAEELAARLRDGRAVLMGGPPPSVDAGPRACARPCAIGEGLRTKVNANIGTSEGSSEIADELAKLDAAVSAGADAVMDLSTGGDLDAVRAAVLARSLVPVGTVPIYDAAVRAVRARGGVTAMTADGMLDAVREHARAGTHFQTIHAGLTREQASLARDGGRIAGIVSRGGAFLACWMDANDAENPFHERFDEVLEICRAHGVVLSLGDSLRPGCLADAGDDAQMRELAILGELVARSRDAGVQVIVEGPGHVPLHEVTWQVAEAKRLTHGAPLYVLGPVVTDVAPGYDHITSAIGGAVAAGAGADFLCYVTRSEHVALPDAADVAEGVTVARIAAHAGDVAKGVPGARAWDDRMAHARKALDWEAQFATALDGDRARSMRAERVGEDTRECSMCGSLCSMRLTAEAECAS